MITLKHLYGGSIKFEAFLYQNNFDKDSECLVRIYTADCTQEEAVDIAKDIKKCLPNANIIGASGSGIIYEGEQYQHDTLVIVEKLEHTKVVIGIYTFQGKTALEVASEVYGQFGEEDASIMHIICGDHYPDVHDFVAQFNKRYSHIKLIGGVAGDILSKNIGGYVFTEDGVADHGIVTAAYYNKELYVFQKVNISHEPISPVYHLDHTQDSLIIDIEGQSAVDWCKDQLGLQKLTHYDDWQMIAENDALIRFPIVLEGHSGASRFIKYDPVAQKISLYFSQLPDDVMFRIGYVSPIKCVSESYAVCNDAEQHPIESFFCYTCLFRKLYLQNCAEWELRPYMDAGICGVFMMGEISNINGVNEFLNGSCCLSGIAEQKNYIQPDYNAFSDLYQIKDDNESLLNFVLKKQSDEMSKENKILLSKLLQQQAQVQNQLYVDMNTGMPNSIKFLQDDQTLCFNKLCMIVIENSDLILSRLGKEGYDQTYKSLCEEIFLCCKQLQNGDDLHFYIQNETMMFITANDRFEETEFTESVNALYRQFQFWKLESKKELLVNRFVMVLNQNDLLEKAFSTIKNCASLQTDFLVWDSSIEAGNMQEAEMNMICILNQALEENRVIPYFQGIHDNKAKVINKYEALMRIADAGGRIYAPAEFMDIAKKYHLYSRISIMMIEQVLNLFKGRKEIISINISAFDINFNLNCSRIYEMLEEIGDASNFVFEILEDEKFRDMAMLKHFINKVRKFGVKIAIDDFGRGYSNFMEIAKMEPDFIKVDGSIIRDVANNILYQKVSKNIVFLGDQLNADLVAEFVENGSIQEMVVQLGMKYSQGYHFAKPVPYEELKLNIK